MTQSAEWQGRVGQSWAEEWRRTDRSFSQLTERLLQEQRGQQFSDVVDIGCGAGEISLAIARNHPHALVTGIDISQDLISAARERGAHMSNAEFLLADAAVWRPDSGRRPQFMVSRHGVMFFDEPAEAFANLRAAAAPDAKLAFSCFQKATDNVWVKELRAAFQADPPAAAESGPGPFAFGDRARVEFILSQAGWRNIAIEGFDYAMIFGSGDDAVEQALGFFTRIGPVARILSELSDEAERAQVLSRLQDLCEQNRVDGIVAMPAAAWIVTAQA